MLYDRQLVAKRHLSAIALTLFCGVILLLLQGLPVRADGVVVSGRVATSSGVGVANVRVVLGGTATYTLTNSTGEYTLPVATAGTYNVGVSKEGFIFDPRYRTVTIGSQSVSGVNFVAIPAFTIRGRVVNGAGAGVPNVRVLRAATVSFPAGSALTNSNGEYVLPPAPAGTYNVTPALEQTIFNPRSRSVTITSAGVTGINFTALPAYVLRGRVANSEGVGAANVKIVISPEPAPAPGTPVVLFYAYTDVNGQFVSPLLLPNSYRLTPMKENLAFEPHYRTVTITNANIGELSFRSMPAYTIGGRVTTSSGEGIGNVTLTLTGGRSVLTNSTGYYAFYSVVPGSYTVTPSKLETVFDPQSRSVTITSAGVYGINFVGLSSTLARSISGRVTNSSGAGVANVRVQRTGSTTAVYTGAEGYYTLPAVQAATYSVTPFKEGLVFDPRARSVTVGTSNVGGVNFTAFPAYTVSGRVATQSGAGVGGARVYIAAITSTGALVGVGSTLTNTEGNYTLPPVRTGTFMVTPAKENFIFDPRSRTVSVGSANVTGINFVALPAFAISGRVTNTSSVGVASVKILLGRITETSSSPVPVAGVFTNADGNYVLPPVVAGNYVVTPVKEGARFDPRSRNVTVSTASVTGINFTALPTYSIYGRVTTSAGAAIANVRIKIDGTTISVLTNSDGFFGLPGLAPATYTLIPILSGYGFTPATRTVTITDGNVSGVTFIGGATVQ